MKQRGLSGAGVLVTLVLALLATPAPLVAEEGEGATTLFSLKASNGYRLIVFGQSDGDDGRGEVGIYAVAKGGRRLVLYRTEGQITATRLKARFGDLGRIDMTLFPSGETGHYRAPAPCNGSKGSFDKATYRGLFEFRGEEGFAAARAGRIAVSPVAWINLICRNEFEVESGNQGGGVRGARLKGSTRGRGRGRTEFQVVKSHPAGRTLVGAVVVEGREGMVISRAVSALVGAAAFEYDDRLATATIDPPAPFSGSATFRRGGKRALRGDLTVDLPGRSGVRLVRPTLRASLVRAAWSVGPPDLR